MNPTPLTPADLEHFYERGHVILKGAMTPEVAEAQVDLAFEKIGCDRHDQSTWNVDRVHLPWTDFEPLVNFSRVAHDAVLQLIGGADRLKGTLETSKGYIISLAYRSDEQWVEPGPRVEGWHKDGASFKHFLDSPEQGLLMLVCFTDVVHQGAATLIATDSVSVVARYLLEHPEGTPPNGFPRLIDQCEAFEEVIASAGDIVLLHPFMLHSVSPNLKRVPRVILNPCVELREPMCFDREHEQDYSPVERAVLRGLGVERLDFQITGERQEVKPGAAGG